jgi:hypothetical protein
MFSLRSSSSSFQTTVHSELQAQPCPGNHGYPTTARRCYARSGNPQVKYLQQLLPYISHFYSSFFWPFNHACMQHSMMSSMRTSSQESGPSFTYTRKKRGEADCFCAILADTRVSSFARSSLVSLNQTMRHDLDVFSRGRKWRRSLTKSLIASVTRYQSERYIFLKNVWFDLAELPLPTALAIPSILLLPPFLSIVPIDFWHLFQNIRL